VLVAALYQQTPPRDRELDDPMAESGPVPDQWSAMSIPREQQAQRSLAGGEGRQLLIFSDNRQHAAFFAPYLNRTYSQILRRRLILKTLQDHADGVVQNEWRVEDLVNPLQQTLDELHLFPEKSLQGRKGEAWKWNLNALVAIDRRNSLEGLSCLGFPRVRPRN